MGCGISRYDPHEYDDAHRPLPNQSLRTTDHNPPAVVNTTKDNGRNPLLFNNINKDDQIFGCSDPNICFVKQPQPQPQISSSTLTSIRHDPTMYVQVSTFKGNVNRGAEPKLSISIKKDIGDREDEDERISNLDDIDASSFLLIGSPSFREYCVVGHDSDSEDDLFLNSHNGNKNSIGDEERGIKMQREDTIMMMSKEASRSTSTVSVGKKKGDKRRMLKKVFPIIHRPAAAVRK